MAKQIRTDPVTAEQIQRHVLSESDFAFELRILPILREWGLATSHSGTYTDPATGKPRQFDIRAERHEGRCSLRLAVECKNLRANNPLIVLCVDRPAADAFHEVVFSSSIRRGLPPVQVHTSWLSLYRRDDPVGKSTVQLAINANNGDPVMSDADTYEKWAQAVASCADLVEWSEADGTRTQQACRVSFVVPTLVVPDGTLWRCRFDEQANARAPEQVDACSMLIDKRYPLRSVEGQLRLSHLEIVTPAGLPRLLNRLWRVGLFESSNDAAWRFQAERETQ